MNSQPVRLAKQETEKSNFEKFCNRIVPYVLFICIVLLIITVFVVLIKYGGNITGTEANHYYNGGLV